MPDTNPSSPQRRPVTNPAALERCPDTNPAALERCPDTNPAALERCPDTNPAALERCPNTNPWRGSGNLVLATEYGVLVFRKPCCSEAGYPRMFPAWANRPR